MTHEPVWLEDWYTNGSCAPNLRLFIRGHLRGRTKLHISGHLHFYMRHSFVSEEPPAQVPECTGAIRICSWNINVSLLSIQTKAFFGTGLRRDAESDCE